MRILVCGGRDYSDYTYLSRQLDRLRATKGVSCIIHGAAKGADSLAAKWAAVHGVKVEPYPANWNEDGRSAGPKRNIRMLAQGKPDGVVSFPGGKGTAHMVGISRSAGVKVWDLRGWGSSGSGAMKQKSPSALS